VYLQAAAAKGGGTNPTFLIVILVLAVAYVFFIRNMRRKQQAKVSEAANMRNTLMAGAEIVTVGGLYATVVDMDDDSVMLEISEGVTARYDRNAIARVISSPDDEEADADSDDLTDSDDQTDSTDLDATANSVIEQKD
jgi:preprotein translocase subunit YajC